MFYLLHFFFSWQALESIFFFHFSQIAYLVLLPTLVDLLCHTKFASKTFGDLFNKILPFFVYKSKLAILNWYSVSMLLAC